jgi:DNA polymerase I-like protein with 3'-5' exonuclease and polymerase domains
MQYHWLIQPEMAHNLAFAAQTWLDIPPWKTAFWEAQDAGEATHTDLSIYNGDDALNTVRLKPHLERELHLRGNAHLLEHQMRVSELARRAELYGVPVCKQTTYQLKEELLDKQRAELDKMIVAIAPHEDAMSKSVWEQKCREKRRKAYKLNKEYVAPPFVKLRAKDFNPNSPHQARWFLFEHLQLQPSRMTAGGVDKDNKQLSHSYKGVLGYLSKPLVEAYVNYGEYDYKLRLIKQIEKHGEDDPNFPGWWRLFVSWRTEGQKGTRWSSKIVNMQNWNKKMRKLLRAVLGRVWVGADAAQIEYRIAAALAGLDELVAIFNQQAFDEEAEPWKKYLGEYDAHSMIAEEVYGDEFKIPAAKYARTHDKKDMGGIAACRTLVKRVVYALFYGAHPPKILQSLREDRRLSPKLRATLTEERITKIWEGFKKRFPAWDAWAEREMYYAQTRGYQEIPPMRRRRYWTQPTVEENKIRNTPIQLAAGDVCNIIFLNIQDRIDREGLDAQMTIHGHDAIYIDTAKEHAERVKQIVNEEFHFQFPGAKGPVHIYGQATIGATVADVG